MKKTFTIKEVLLQVTFITAILLIANTRNNPLKLENEDIEQEQNDLNSGNNTPYKDTQLLVIDAEITMAQIPFGKLVIK